jgi:hypothetical protein
MSARHDDPRRLVEGDAAFAEIEAGLRRARERGPSGEQAARMRAALGLAPAPATPPQPAPSEPATAVRTSWLKLIAGGLLTIAVALGIWHGAVRGPHVEPPIATDPQPAPQLAPANVDPATAAAPAATPPIPLETRGGAGAASAHPHRTAPRVNRGAPAARASADPGAELVLLRRAKADARSAPAHALRLVAEHEQRFPNGVLVEEREVIAIEALLASGQRAASEARAARFFKRFPNSAHARRVHALLEHAHSDTKSSVAPHP